jgi:hypothetical protein
VQTIEQLLAEAAAFNGMPQDQLAHRRLRPEHGFRRRRVPDARGDEADSFYVICWAGRANLRPQREP